MINPDDATYTTLTDVTPLADVSRFERQLPITIFDGCPAKPRGWRAWTPKGRSAVDVWAVEHTEAGGVFHLLELKAADNHEVGILSETLVYALLLEAVRRSAPQVQGGGTGIDALRRSARRSVWLVAPEYHPLVLSEVSGAKRSPAEWIHERLASEDVEFRILPVQLRDDSRWERWHLDDVVPALRRSS